MTHRVNSGDMKNLNALKGAAKRMTTAEADRNRLIVEARVDGYPWDSIAAAAGLTRQGAEKVAKRANGGTLPRPRQRTAA